MAKNVDDHIFIIIGDRAFTLKDLGPAADMRIDKAMQSIIDQGLLGEELKGRPWYEIIKSSGMQLEMEPTEDDELVYTLYQRYNDALLKCKELSKAGELTQEHKSELMKLRQTWRAAEKLSRP